MPAIHQRASRAIAATLLIAIISGGLPARPAVAQTRAVSAADAAQPATIPDVPLTARDGTPTTTAKALPAQGRWLLLHVQRGSAASASLLGRIQGEAWAAVPPRLIIIVSGTTAAELDQFATKFPALTAATWYADEPAALAAALPIQESPLVLAMNNRGIQWTLSGVLSGSKKMQTVLTSWVATPSAAVQH
jgi:hypothetical protein